MRIIDRIVQGLFGRQLEASPSTSQHTNSHQPPGSPQPSVANTAREDLRYPPADAGLPLGSVEQLLQIQDALIERTKLLTASRGERFDTKYGNPIRRMARTISTLPATQAGLYAGPGGLFTACMESAFFSCQASDGKIFTGSLGVEARHLMEPRWRYVCFLGGLLHPIGKTLQYCRVLDAQGNAWASRVEPILDWAQDHPSNVFCHWPKDSFEPGPAGATAMLIPQIVGEDNLRWLEEASPELITALTGIATGDRNDRWAIAFDCVSGMWSSLCAMEKARRPATYGAVQHGSHLASHLIDLMSDLVDRKAWVVNERVMHADATGVYIEWPEGGDDMLSNAKKTDKQGMPMTTNGLMNALLETDLVVSDDAIGFMREVVVEGGEIKPALKLKKPEAILRGYTTADFASCRPVTPEGIRKTDPIAQAEQATKARQEVITKGNATPARPAPADTKTLHHTAISTPNMPPAPRADPLPSTLLSEAHPEPEPKPPTAPEQQEAQAPAQKIDVAANLEAVEPPINPEPVLKYSDILPPHLRRGKMPAAATELLGKLVKEWQEKAPNEHMRTVESGAAIALDMLKDFTANPVNFLEAMANAGLLYVPMETPGKKISDVIIPEGSGKKVRCFVISKGIASQLGM